MNILHAIKTSNLSKEGGSMSSALTDSSTAVYLLAIIRLHN